MKLEIETTSNNFSGQSYSPKKSSAEEIAGLLDDGIQAARDGNRVEARRLFLHVTETMPENEDAWLWLASISEYPEELLAFLQNLLNVNPNNERALEWTSATKSLLAENFVRSGENALQKERKDVAQQFFLKAISQNPQNEPAWLKLSSLAETRDDEMAHLQKVLEINPANETALSVLAAIEKEDLAALLKKANFATISGERENALQLLEEIMQRAPDVEDAWILKAYLAENSQEKIDGYEKVLELNPDNEAAQAGLAALQSLIQKTEEQKPFAEALKAAFEANNMSENFASGSSQNFSADADDSNEMHEKFSDVDYSETESAVNDSNRESFVETKSSLPEPEYSAFNSDVESDRIIDGKFISVEEEAYFADILPVDSANDNQLGNSYSQMANEFSSHQNAADFSGYNESKEVIETLRNSDETDLLNLPSANLPTDASGQFDANKLHQSVEENSFDSHLETTGNQSEELFSPPLSDNSNFVENTFSSDEYEFPTHQDFNSNEASNSSEKSFACPFCYMMNEPQTIICSSCRTMLSLADLEAMIGYQAANPEILQAAINKFENLRNSGEITVDKLKNLAVAYVNVKNFENGLNCLREAAQMSPNDSEIVSQINFLTTHLAKVEPSEEFEKYDGKHSTIMVVDDNPTILKLVSGKLEKCGHTVISALDGEEALTKINDVTPDLILLDIAMPKMDGYQICKVIRAKEKTKDVPVLMISGKDGIFDESRGKMAGSTGFIAKPFGPETLMRTIESYLN